MCILQLKPTFTAVPQDIFGRLQPKAGLVEKMKCFVCGEHKSSRWKKEDDKYICNAYLQSRIRKRQVFFSSSSSLSPLPLIIKIESWATAQDPVK